MAATIKDIARKLNISISTVSYALNGGPRPVPEEVRERVLATARELDYRPNSIARSMATGRTATLAVVPPRMTSHLLASPYTLTVLSSIVDAAGELLHDILLHTAPANSDPDTLASTIMGGKADGVILIAPPVGSPVAAHLAARDFPCVVLNADGPEGVVRILTDNHAATEQALKHLMELGHRRIGHVAGPQDLQDGVERRAAFLALIAQYGLPCQENWIVPGQFHYEHGRNAARQLLMQPGHPTAILAGNDESGIGVIDAARELGIRVPEELSVVAYDVLPSATLQMRRVTAVRQPIQEMAEHATRLLVDWVREGKRPDPSRRIFATELVDLGSTAPAIPES
jgi:DNA-binding LacI/PurR family transcriptional regulator